MIDTHQHLLYPEHFNYAWAADLPALQGGFRIPDYQTAAAGCGIEGTIFMEVDVAPHHSAAEARFFCEMANDPASGILGVIAACRPEQPDFQSQLEALSHPRLLGLRRVLHTQPDEVSTSALFRDNLRCVGQAGLTFDLIMAARQLPLAAALVDACPDTRFILDHCGEPNLASGDLTFWHAQLRELAQRPNLHCKISGIIAYPTGDITADTLRPVVEHTIDCFGWDRIVWGSDWPVCNLTRDLPTWTSLLGEILTGCSPDELARFYHRNARAVYRI